MKILTFTDAELAQISAESATFAAKVAGDKTFQPAPTETLNPKSSVVTHQEREVKAYLETIRRTNSPSRCIDLVRAWAKEHGYSGFASLAGAKRLVATGGQTTPENDP
jgi:hypothetical protein